MPQQTTKITRPTPEEVRLLVDFFLNGDDTPTEGTYQTIAEIIGAAIGLKPAAMRYRALTLDKAKILQSILSGLHLQYIIEVEGAKDLPSDQKYYDFFMSQNLATAKELRNTLHASRALGWYPNNPEDQKLTYKIGCLLGYPKTATHYFAYGPRNAEGIPKRRPGSDRDRYYIHSPEHFRAEYEQFEDILHAAVAELTPKTASVMRENPTLCWTSADL